jgi:hypothetical protein
LQCSLPQCRSAAVAAVPQWTRPSKWSQVPARHRPYGTVWKKSRHRCLDSPAGGRRANRPHRSINGATGARHRDGQAQRLFRPHRCRRDLLPAHRLAQLRRQGDAALRSSHADARTICERCSVSLSVESLSSRQHTVPAKGRARVRHGPSGPGCRCAADESKAGHLRGQTIETDRALA